MTVFRSNYDVTHPFTDMGAKVSMLPNAELTWTVPGTNVNQYRAEFSYQYGSQVWVKLNGTITSPVGGTVATTYNEEFMPDVRYVVGGDVLHFITTGTTQLGVSLLQIPTG